MFPCRASMESVGILVLHQLKLTNVCPWGCGRVPWELLSPGNVSFPSTLVLLQLWMMMMMFKLWFSRTWHWRWFWTKITWHWGSDVRQMPGRAIGCWLTSVWWIFPSSKTTKLEATDQSVFKALNDWEWNCSNALMRYWSIKQTCLLFYTFLHSLEASLTSPLWSLLSWFSCCQFCPLPHPHACRDASPCDFENTKRSLIEGLTRFGGWAVLWIIGDRQNAGMVDSID